VASYQAALGGGAPAAGTGGPRAGAGRPAGGAAPSPAAHARAAAAPPPPPRAACDVRFSLWGGDALALCSGAGALPAGARFDAVDASNLPDHVGFAPLLLAAGPRLAAAPGARLHLDLMVWPTSGADSLEVRVGRSGGAARWPASAIQRGPPRPRCSFARRCLEPYGLLAAPAPRCPRGASRGRPSRAPPSAAGPQAYMRLALGGPPGMLPALYGLRLMDDLRWGPARRGALRPLSFAPAGPSAAAAGAAAPLAPAARGGVGGAEGGAASAVRALARLCLAESAAAVRDERCGLGNYRCGAAAARPGADGGPGGRGGVERQGGLRLREG
jgi:hypothetical protein